MRVQVHVLVLTAVAVLAVACGRSNSGLEVVASDRSAACLRPICEEVPVERGVVTVSVSADGTLRFVNKADLFFQAPGRVTSVTARIGDVVQKGQTLATLDPASLELTVAEAAVLLKNAQEALEVLLEPIKSEQLSAAKLAVSVAEDARSEAEAKLQLAQSGPSAKELAQAVADLSAAPLALQEAEAALVLLFGGPTAEALAEAMNSVARDTSALLAAERTLTDLINQVSAIGIVVQAAENDLALAAAYLVGTEATLAALELGPDPPVVADQEKTLELARIGVLEAEVGVAQLEELDADLRDDPLSEEWALAEARLVRAVRDAEDAEQALDLTLAGPTDQELNSARLDVASAEAAMAQAEQSLKLASITATEQELSAAEGSVDAARAIVAVSRQKLADLNADPDILAIIARQDQVALAEVNLEDAQKNLDKLNAGPDADRISKLHLDLTEASDAEAGAKDSLEELLNHPDSSQVELKRREVGAALAKLAEAQGDLDRATIEAPFDGIVGGVNVESGQDVQPHYGPLEGSEVALIELLDTRAVEIVALVDEDDVGQVSVGQIVDITVNALAGTIVRGTVANVSTIAIEPQQGSNDTVYEVTISADAGELARLNLLEGMTASNEIVIDRRSDVLYVPVGALKSTNLQTSIDVVDGQRVTGVDVIPGLMSRQLVEVVDGVEEGQVVRVYRSAITPLRQ